MPCVALPLPAFGDLTPATEAITSPQIGAASALVPEVWAQEALKVIEDCYVEGIGRKLFDKP